MRDLGLGKGAELAYRKGMVTRPLAYNLIRLALGSIHSTPRGIDRIDFGYVSSLLETWPADVRGVLPTILGMRAFPRDQILRGRDRLARLWREEALPSEDPGISTLIQRMEAPEAPYPRFAKRGVLPDITGLKRLGHLLLEEGISFGTPVRALPEGSIYLDVGHFGLTFPGAMRWLKDRPDVIPVFMIHDAIPLEFPHLVAEDTVRAHARLMDIAARHAQRLIVPTHAAGEEIARALRARGAAPIPINAIPLPIDDLFSPGVSPHAQLCAHPYFVITGAIEPRKNHDVLLQVWRRLVGEMGEDAPFLVIAGSPGHAAEKTLTAVLEEPALRRRIVFAQGLSSPALAQVMAGARALLMPSLAEGFGLPPAEALALGTPAVLSDIPAHREAVGQHGCFLPATDVDAWHNSVKALIPQEGAAQARAQAASYTPRRWADYFGAVTETLHQLDA